MNKIKLSVIIPVFNVEMYIEPCILSLLNQKVKKNLYEVIFINDGSTDKSLDIIQKYETKFDNIKIITQVNKGLGAARNRGLMEATGEYIYFFDSDDLLDENAFSHILKNMTENLDILMFAGKGFTDNNELYSDLNKFVYSKEGDYSAIAKGTQMFDELINNREYTSSVCLYIINSNFLKNLDLRFEEDLLHEDELFTFFLLHNAQRVKIIPNILFYRRLRTGSIMTDINYEKSYFSFIRILTKLTNLYRKQDRSKQINIKFSQLYRSALGRFYKLNEARKISIEPELKRLALENHFFYKIDILVFYISPNLYYILKKLIKGGLK